MHPEILKVGPITLHTYGLMLALAFFSGLLVMLSEAKRTGQNPDLYGSLFLWLLLSAVLGARIAFVAFFWEDFKDSPLSALNIASGGLMYFGGLIFCLAFLILYARAKRLPLLRLLDTISPGLALGYAIARIGCLGAGCCYGRPTEGAFGLVFTDPNCLVPIHLRGIPLYPTQALELLNGLFCFVVLWVARTRLKKEGLLTAAFLTLFGLNRFLIEFLRGDVRGAFFVGMSESQLASLIQALIGLGLFAYVKSAPKKQPEP
jgi:phosphatidylglycerol:prolipoprotein diacylglycerol transferase